MKFSGYRGVTARSRRRVRAEYRWQVAHSRNVTVARALCGSLRAAVTHASSTPAPSPFGVQAAAVTASRRSRARLVVTTGRL